MRNLLFIGLGNPGFEYNNTRHNVGFDILNTFANKIHKSFSYKNDGEYFHIDTHDDSIRCHFFKPMTYMNNAGQPVKKLIKNINIEREKIFYNKEKNTQLVNDIFVFCDDLDTKIGVIKIKYGKGSHNGYKSLNENISGLYHKINIGIDRPHNEGDVSNYVLAKFHPTEKEIIHIIINKITTNLTMFIENDITLHDFFKNITKQ